MKSFWYEKGEHERTIGINFELGDCWSLSISRLLIFQPLELECCNVNLGIPFAIRKKINLNYTKKDM